MRKEILGGTEFSQTIAHFDDNELIIEERMDDGVVRDILDHNAKVRNEGLRNPAAHGRLVASIPFGLYNKWRREWRAQQKVDWNVFLAAKLNSAEWKNLKTITGSI